MNLTYKTKQPQTTLTNYTRCQQVANKDHHCGGNEKCICQMLSLIKMVWTRGGGKKFVDEE